MSGYSISHWLHGFALAASIGTLLSGAAVARAQTLTETLATAYQTNPALAAARAQLRIVNESVSQELANTRPTLSLSGSAGLEHSFSTEEDDEEAGTSIPRRLSLDLSQPVYRGGRTVAGISRAENEVLAQRARVRGREQEVLLAAATAYTDVWRDQTAVSLNLATEEVLGRQLSASRERLRAGDVTRTDVTQAQSRLAGAMAARQAAEGRLRFSRAVFAEIVGIPPLEELDPPVAPATVLPMSRDEAVEIARREHPEVIAAEYAGRAAERSIRQSLGSLYPEISLVGSLVHERDELDTSDDASGAQVVLQLRVPLYQAGAASSRVRGAKQEESLRRRELELAERSAERAAIAAWEARQAARAQIVSLETQVEAARSALQGVRQESLAGARTTLDVLDAEQELLTAQVLLLGARRDEVVATFQLQAALGGLGAGALGLPVELYDPVADYEEVREAWFGLDAPGWQPTEVSGASD